MPSLLPNELIPVFKNRSGQGGWGNDEFEQIITDIVNGLIGGDALLLDGSNAMTGDINTENGQINSASVASTVNAAFKLNSNSSVFPTSGGVDGTRLAEFLDSNNNGLILQRGTGSFGGGALVFNSNNTQAGTDLEFLLNGLLGIVKFTDSLGGNTMGFRPSASFLTTSDSNIGIAVNNSSNPTVNINVTEFFPTATNAIDIGTNTERFRNLFLSGNASIGDAITDTLGFYGAVNVAQPTALTAPDNNIPNSGDATTDAIIANLQTRVNELETKIQSLGLLA